MLSLDAKTLKLMFENGSRYIKNNYEYIDELNIFPVPDGDTGTNLKITTSNAYETIQNLETQDILELSKKFARGLLMNARGNSGVILSQIFKGFSSVFKEGQTEASIAEVIDAFDKAREHAYNCVSTPIEGTILTVIRVIAQKLLESSGKFKSVDDVFSFAYKEGKIILDKTPDFLLQLKQAGVVDSGGYGLVCFLEGMKNIILKNDKLESNTNTQNISSDQHKSIVNKNFIDNNEGFGYCAEFIMKLGSRVSTEQKQKENFNESHFKYIINRMGNSFVYVRDGNLVKVHIHVIEPYRLLWFASRYGEFTKIKIENLTTQFLMRNKNTSLEKLEKDFNTNEISDVTKVVAVVPTEELKQVYHDEFNITNCLNCSKIGNPTIQQFYDLIKSAKSTHVIVVTDNGNVIMAAEQAIKLFPSKKYKIELIPSKDIATSFLTCLSFNPELNKNDIYKNMLKTFKTISSGKISKSVKNINYKNLNIKINDFIAVRNQEIIFNSKNSFLVVKKLIDDLFRHKSKKAIVIIYGQNTTIEEVNEIVKYISEKYLIKPIIIQGNQSTYHYYIGTLR